MRLWKGHLNVRICKNSLLTGLGIKCWQLLLTKEVNSSIPMRSASCLMILITRWIMFTSLIMGIKMFFLNGTPGIATLIYDNLANKILQIVFVKLIVILFFRVKRNIGKAAKKIKKFFGVNESKKKWSTELGRRKIVSRIVRRIKLYVNWHNHFQNAFSVTY